MGTLSNKLISIISKRKNCVINSLFAMNEISTPANLLIHTQYPKKEGTQWSGKCMRNEHSYKPTPPEL